MLFAVVGEVVGKRYVVTQQFLPQQSTTQSSALSGIASQFGVSVPTGGEGALSAQLYADLVRSQFFYQTHLQDPAANPQPRAKTIAGGVGVALDTTTDDQSLDLIGRRILRYVQARVTTRTGVVVVTVSHPDRATAVAISEMIRDGLTSFNRSLLVSRASAEVRFLDDVVRERLATVRRLEDEVQQFLEENRQGVQSSPALSFSYERLMGGLTRARESFVEVSRLLDRARLNELRDTPVLSTIQPVLVPIRPTSVSLIARTLIGALAGMLLAGGLLALKSLRLRPPSQA
jgi:hypothetical protein